MSSFNNISSSIILGTDPSSYQVEYNPIPSIDNFHDLPRFSRSDDFSLLFSSNPDDNRQYALGLMFLAILIISLFTVWGVAICVMKCIGPKFVGVFSGYPYRQDGCRATSGRIVFASSAASILLLSILLITKGWTQLESTRVTVEMTNADAMAIHDELSLLTWNLQQVARQAFPVREQLLTTLQQDICPLLPAGSSSSSSSSTIETMVRANGNTTLDDLQDLDDFMSGSGLQTMNDAMQQLSRATGEIEVAVDKVQFTGPQVTALMFPFFIIPAVLLVAVMMGSFDVFAERFYSIMTWLVMPFFILMIMAAFLAAGWILVTIQGNSDFCFPSPEQNIENILGRYEGLQQGQLYYDSLLFYANQCKAAAVDKTAATNPWSFLEVYHDQLTQAKDSVDIFYQLVLEQTPEQLSQECGIEYSPVMELLYSLNVHTAILRNTSKRALQLMSCANIVPLYTNAVYDGVCHDSLVGAHWTFSCLLLIAFFGMLCIMFRGAYYPIDYFYFTTGEGDDDDDEKSLYSTSESEEMDDDEFEGRHEVVDTATEENDLHLDESQEKTNE